MVQSDADIPTENMMANDTVPLYEEPVNLLVQEIRETAIYTAVIYAIAGGATRVSEISGKVGEDTNVCTAYLKSLMKHGLVEKRNTLW